MNEAINKTRKWKSLAPFCTFKISNEPSYIADVIDLYEMAINLRVLALTSLSAFER